MVYPSEKYESITWDYFKKSTQKSSKNPPKRQRKAIARRHRAVAQSGPRGWIWLDLQRKTVKIDWLVIADWLVIRKLI